MTADKIFRVWMAATAAVFAAFFVWAYVPILIPLGIVVGVLGLFTAAVRNLVARYGRNHDAPHDDGTA